MTAAHVLVPVALLAVSSPALSAPAVRLAYEAPRGCPSEPEFVAAVTARGADFDGGKATGQPHVMVVSINRGGDGFVGAFQLRDDEGATNKREVRNASCAEVADALAVVTAIALHADADGGDGAPSVAPRQPEPAPAPAEGTTPAATSPATGAVPTPPDDRLRGSTRIFPPRTDSVAVRAGTLRFDLQRSATVYAGASGGMIPSVILPRADLSLLAAHFVTTPEGEPRISGLVLKLRLGALGAGTYRSPDTKTDLSAFTFGIDLCQSPLYDSKGLVLLFCGGFGSGLMMLKTNALDGTAIQSKKVGFGEATLSAEAEFYVGGGFHLGARVGGGFTVGQVTAERADGSRIFASSPWSWYATLGVGFRF